MDLVSLAIASNAQEQVEIVQTQVIEVHHEVEALPRGLVYKGAVNYQNNLPIDAEVGDTYTVLYKGTSGATAWDVEFAWGNYQGVDRWIEIGARVPVLSVDGNSLIITT